VTETKLPDELEAQAILHALGILDPEERRAFMLRLQGESELVRQAVAAYQATADALATAVAPVPPPAILRDRLINRIAHEAAREAEQFELAANTVALGSVPLQPRDSVRERLLSRIERHVEVRLVAKDAMHSLEQTPVSSRDELRSEGRRHPAQGTVDSLSGRRAQAWRHLLVTAYTSLRLSAKALSNLLRTILPHAGTSRSSETKIGFQQPGKGLTFIKAVEGAWRELAPGVTAKVLSFDMTSRRATTLLRFAPGTSYAPHRHTEVEELYVLEGGCSIAGREMAIGDYHRAEAGTEHYDTSTDDGCLLLVISSPANEMLQ